MELIVVCLGTIIAVFNKRHAKLIIEYHKKTFGITYPQWFEWFIRITAITVGIGVSVLALHSIVVKIGGS